MSGTTLVAAKQHLDRWLAADLAVSAGQAYTIGNRSLTRASVAEIRTQIQHWSREVERLEAAARGARAPGIATASWS